MSYPGNSALPPDVQERILQTYTQSLDLASSGKLQEAKLGCDFVLRLDNMFGPARKLQDRLAEATGAVAVDDLRPGAIATAPAIDDSFADLGGLDDLPDLEPAPSLGSRLAELIRRRDFGGVLELAGAHQGEVVADPELRRLAMQASERLEAAPLVAGMLDAARRALDSGHSDEAERQLAQARELDPDHPDVLLLEGQMSSDDDGFDLDDEGLGQLAAPALDFAAADAPGLSFDLDTGAKPESDPRIAELLADGQRAFEAGEFQAAIDAWSRIFLIDIDHAEANRRIEDARRRRAEGERQLEERLHEAEALVDQGDPDRARKILESILAEQPGFYAAQELLDRLDAPAPGPGASGTRVASAAAEVLTEEILVPPEPGAPPRRTAPATALPKPRHKKSRRLPMLIGVGVLVLLAAAATGWWLLTRGEEVFPNAVETVAETPSPIDRARSLYESGKPANAIALLKRVPAGEQFYDEAQQLLAQWEQVAAGPAIEEPTIDDAEIARIEQLVTDARVAFDQRRLLRAADLYDQAAAAITLEPEDLERQGRANVQRNNLSQVRGWLRDAEYEVAMPELWKRYEADRGDADLQSLLVTGYYNMALREVQRGLYPKALDALEEAARLAPGDEGVQRLKAFATTYKVRGDDLLSRIYVKYAVPRVP